MERGRLKTGISVSDDLFCVLSELDRVLIFFE